MIRNLAALEVKKEDRTYSMFVENNAPLGEVYDALSEMRSYIFERIKSVQEEAKKAEEAKNSEPVSVE